MIIFFKLRTYHLIHLKLVKKINNASPYEYRNFFLTKSFKIKAISQNQN